MLKRIGGKTSLRMMQNFDVARFHADAEAVYSYEGTHEINALVVARAATGLSAFTR